MVGQRRGRWANISPASGQRLVFDRLSGYKAVERNGWETDSQHRRLTAGTETGERTSGKQYVPTSL